MRATLWDDQSGGPTPSPPIHWGSTGARLPDLVGGYALPPGTHGDLNRRELLASLIAALYSAAGSAQRAELSDDHELHAVHQMVIANGALAASEADAFLRLISVGIEAAAQIHLRALGEMTRRIVLCRQYRSLALELFNTSAPAWTRLAAKLGISTASEYDQTVKDMRSQENSQVFKDARNDIIKRFHLLSDVEWVYFSKRSHGDIYALVEVSQNLRIRDADVYRAINKVLPEGKGANILLDRVIGFALISLLEIANEFGMSKQANIEAFTNSYREMQEVDKATGALRI